MLTVAFVIAGVIASTHANDWASPCTSGICGYDWAGDGTTSAVSSMMLVRVQSLACGSNTHAELRLGQIKSFQVHFPGEFNTFKSYLLALCQISRQQRAGKSWAAILIGPMDRITFVWCAQELPRRWPIVTICTTMVAPRRPLFVSPKMFVFMVGPVA
jgi:hypothetical protein